MSVGKTGDRKRDDCVTSDLGSCNVNFAAKMTMQKRSK